MKLYDWLALPGRKFDPHAPIPGLSPCLVDGQAFFKTKPNTGGARDLSTLGDAEAKAWALTGAIGAPVVLDIEWRRFDPTDIGRDIRTDVRNNATGPEVEEDAAFLRAALGLVKPSARGPVGVYDLLPSGFNIYNLVLCSDGRGLARASASNDYLAATGLIDDLDALYPSLYAPYIDDNARKVWAKVAAWTRGECRRLAPGKPAIAFLKPVAASTNELLPLQFWKDQLAVCRDAGFDGAILWAGGLEKTTWADAAAHVAAAQAFAGYVAPRYDTMTFGNGFVLGHGAHD